MMVVLPQLRLLRLLRVAKNGNRLRETLRSRMGRKGMTTFKGANTNLSESEFIVIHPTDLCLDPQRVVEKSFAFPLYFYSIKAIAKSESLNFKWRHEKAGGGESVFWYENG